MSPSAEPISWPATPPMEPPMPIPEPMPLPMASSGPAFATPTPTPETASATAATGAATNRILFIEHLLSSAICGTTTTPTRQVTDPADDESNENPPGNHRKPAGTPRRIHHRFADTARWNVTRTHRRRIVTHYTLRAYGCSRYKGRRIEQRAAGPE
ncbi:hypothetical protein FO059_15475 [Tomitella fengzijianii]|uniref:Uncharacterized protein n=1 Tax=Tomitella fengzijianii TaxID=2597660 RepID=A0A516X5W1_9ACTN|nr:hypothetical protein FO059_15475 [Tomitella fengzijianii]